MRIWFPKNICQQPTENTAGKANLKMRTDVAG